MVDDGGCVVVVGGVSTFSTTGREGICRSISLINTLQIELMKVLMKTGTSNVEKPEVPGCCPGKPVYLAFCDHRARVPVNPRQKVFFFCLIKLWLLLSPSSLSSSSFSS